MAPSQASDLVYAGFALFAALLLIVQLPVHFEPTRSSNWLFVIWLILVLISSSINAIIWRDNVVDWAPVWCDISANFIIASHFGVPLSLLCISRRLYGAVIGKTVNWGFGKERRGMYGDIFISIGVPLLALPLCYIIETKDYLIGEQEGCYPVILRTIPAIVVFLIWPPIFALVTAVYSALTMFAMLRQRARVRKFGKKVDGYHWRLTLLACTEIVLMLPLAIFHLVMGVDGPIIPYNWNAMHAQFSSVLLFPIDIWTYNTLRAVQFELYDHWIHIAYAILFIGFFGWTERARVHYKRYYVPVFLAVTRPFGFCRHRDTSADQERGIEICGPTSSSSRLSSETLFVSIASRFTTSQATTTYQTETEQVISGPKLEIPAPVYHRTPMAVLYEDQTDTDDCESLEFACVDTPAVAPVHPSDHIPPTTPVVKPEPVLLGHNR